MNNTIANYIQPLIKRQIFISEDEAIQAVIKYYIDNQISDLKEINKNFEKKYGINFQNFEKKLHEKSTQLLDQNFSKKNKLELSQNIMNEEDDWLEWKASYEMLQTWKDVFMEVSN